MTIFREEFNSATHNISGCDFVRKDGRITSGGRTVAHVFDLATHENDERIVRKSLHKFLSPGLVLAGRNSGSEFISFDWERANQNTV